MAGGQPDEIDIGRLLASPPDTDRLEQQRIAAEAKARLLGTPSAVRLGRYALLRWIGAGAFGVVYAARDPEMERDVAIKLLHASSDRALDRRAAMLHEARMQAQVVDPHVVEVFDVGWADERAFVVMRLVDGGDVEAWWREESPASALVVDAIAQAGRGLAAAHRIGLVHRDVKPTNLLRTRDGVVKVADFGLAVTPSGGRIGGTPLFMAPEQRVGASLDGRTDQFSLALVAVRLLTGEIGLPRRRPPRIGAALASVLDRALQPDPARRFPVMDRFVDALERALRPPRARVAWWASAVVASTAIAVASSMPARTVGFALDCDALGHDDLVPPAACLGDTPTLDASALAGMARIDDARVAIHEARYEAAADVLADVLAERVDHGAYVRAEAWYLRAKLDVRNGDDDLAAARFETAYHYAIDASHWWIAVDCATNLAGWAAERQDREAAHRWLQDADALVERAGTPLRLRASWWNAAIGVHLARGDLERAIAAAREAVAAHRELGPSAKLVSALRGQAMTSLMAGRPAESEPAIREALEVAESLGGPNARGRGELLDLLSGTLVELGRPDAALEHQREAVAALSTEYGERHPITHAPRLNLASLLLALDRENEAIAILRALVHELDEADSPSRVRPVARLDLARALRLAGSPDEAETLAVRAIVELESRNDLRPPTLGEAHEELAAIALATGDRVAATRAYERAASAYGDRGLTEAAARAVAKRRGE
jgi:eukaryotic-like serine/threonine-protein kinase